MKTGILGHYLHPHSNGSTYSRIRVAIKLFKERYLAAVYHNSVSTYHEVTLNLKIMQYYFFKTGTVTVDGHISVHSNRMPETSCSKHVKEYLIYWNKLMQYVVHMK